jgi:hypothetical protein
MRPIDEDEIQLALKKFAIIHSGSGRSTRCIEALRLPLPGTTLFPSVFRGHLK